MTIKVRLSGEIARLVAQMRHEYDVAGSDQTYPNRGSFGVRVYVELRERVDRETMTRWVESERVHPRRKEIKP